MLNQGHDIFKYVCTKLYGFPDKYRKSIAFYLTYHSIHTFLVCGFNSAFNNFPFNNDLTPLDIDGLYSWNNLLNEYLYIASHLSYTFIIPPANFVCRGYTVFTLSVRPSVRLSVTLCFLNNSKSHCWIFIKPCKHVHICKTNTLDKKVRARGQFY